MFSSLGLFKKTRCPDIQNCKRTTCIFSHTQDAPAEPTALNIPVNAPQPQPQLQPRKERPTPTPSSSALQTRSVPSKRSSSELQTPAVGPPRKISKVGPTKNPSAVPTSTQTSVSPQPLEPRSAVRVHNTQDVTHSSLAFPYSKYPQRIP